MDRQELGQRIVDWTPLLYHVACGLLSGESDREDAVQSAIEKAWRKGGLPAGTEQAEAVARAYSGQRVPRIAPAQKAGNSHGNPAGGKRPTAAGAARASRAGHEPARKRASAHRAALSGRFFNTGDRVRAALPQGHRSFAHEPRPQAIKTLPDGGMNDEKMGFPIWRGAGELFPARP